MRAGRSSFEELRTNVSFNVRGEPAWPGASNHERPHAHSAPNTQAVAAVITTHSVNELKLVVGSEVVALVKSTEVSIAKL